MTNSAGQGSTMQGELVSVWTADRVRLDGFFQVTGRPVSRVPATLLFVHGLGGNFYGSRLLNFLTERALERGVNALLVKTRGHDSMATLSQAGRAQLGGAAFERVGESHHDLRAWAEWAAGRTGGDVLLVGHSLGAIKSLLTQARSPLSMVTGVIGLSATRLNHEQLLASPGGVTFRKCLEQAERAIAAGKGGQLLDVDFPFPTWMAASAYREKYGPENANDWVPGISDWPTPTLLVFGERELEENPAFQGLQTILERELEGQEEVDCRIIPKANHFYAGQFPAVWECLQQWLNSRSLG